MNPRELAEASNESLREAIWQLQALRCALDHARCELISEYDRRQAWTEDGASSMPDWLTTYCATSRHTAHEEVRVAHALGELPEIAARLADGSLSWEQTRHATRIAEPETDHTVAEMACGASVAWLERLARRRHAVTHEQSQTEHDARYVSFRWTTDHRMLRMRGLLPALEGTEVMEALRRIAETAARSGSDPDERSSHPQRMADALVDMAKTKIAADADADRATVVVHVDAHTLSGGPGLAELESGAQLAHETIRRLVCDGRIEYAIHGPDGATIGIRRASRNVPPALLRQLKYRDGGCAFPGCGRNWCVQAHHLRPWIAGGETNLDNLILLCSTHHTAVHERGWKVKERCGGGHQFIRPDGLPYTGPAPLRPDVRKRFWDTDTS